MAQTPLNDRDIKFRDGLGLRVITTDASGDAVEQLLLPTELANQESAIRDRVGRLVNFRHVKYVRLRGVERLKQGGKELVVSYDAVEGDRLSTILEHAAKAPLSVDVDVALQLVRDLLPGIGILHDSRKVTHGAIGPERLIYTPQHRLVIVDHGFGLALGRLNQNRRKLWDQYRIAVPGSARGVFDERTDVIQIGLVALALLLGRPLTDDDYPGQLKRLILSIKEHSAKRAARPVSPELKQWLERALPVDEEQPFKTVRDAQEAFESFVAKSRYAPSAAAVKAFLTRYRESAAAASARAADSERSEDSSATVDRALEEFAITIGPKAPVSKSKSSTPAAAPPAPEPVVAPEPIVDPAPAEAAPQQAAEAARTLVIASAIEGHAAAAGAPAEAAGAPAADALKTRTSRKSDRLSESALARERVGDAARRARQTTLAPRTAAPLSETGHTTDAGQVANADAPRKTRGRLDALRALEDELSRLAALDLVMPRHPIATAPAASDASPIVAGEAAAPIEVVAAAEPLASAATPEAPSVIARVDAAEPVVMSPAALDPVVLEQRTPEALSLETTPSELAVVEAAPAEARAEARPFQTDAIDAELAKLMGERDPDECATPIWTIDAEATNESPLALEAPSVLPDLAPAAAASEPAIVEAVAAVESSSKGDEPVFELTPPSAGASVVLASFELTAPVAETEAAVAGPVLLELSAFEQAAFDTYDTVAAGLTERQTTSLFDAAAPIAEQAVTEPAVHAEPMPVALTPAEDVAAIESSDGAANEVTAGDRAPAGFRFAFNRVRKLFQRTNEPVGAPNSEAAQFEQPIELVLDAEHASAPAIESQAIEQARFEAEAARLEAERAEAARFATERLEAARLEAERAEAARLEAERLEAARLEAERLEAERAETARLEAERLEAARLEAARVEAARLEAERLEATRLEAERAEAARLETERAEAARLEAERLEAARLEAARVEAARLEAERLEAARREAERAEAARLEAERLEAARLEAERAEAARLEAERLEAARREAERAEAARLEAERLEAARREAERAEAARLEAERLEAARLEAARVEAARIEAVRLEAERLEAVRVEAARLEAERAEAARIEAARLEAERAEAARIEGVRLEAERLEATRLDAERAEAARLAAEAVAAPAEESRSRRRNKRRKNKRHGEAAVDTRETPTAFVEATDAVAMPAATVEAPMAAAPVASTAQRETAERAAFYEFDSSQVADAVPAWARGAANQTPVEASEGEPQGIGAVQFETEGAQDSSRPAADSRPAWQTHHEPPATASNVIAFQPQAERDRTPVSSDQPSEATVTPMRPKRRPFLFRIHWGRTLAASLVLALLEGVAFAAAWWYVTPTELGWLIVHTKPAGIEISVDGMSRGTTPFALSLKPGRHTIELRQGTAVRVVPVEISAGVQTEQRITWGKAFKTGQARITSTPEGARVVIDGNAHGKTPVTVSELSAGMHTVTVEASSGSVTSSLIVEAGETTELDVPVFSGWVSVLSPVELEIREQGRLLGTTEAEKIMLAPGLHKLDLRNVSLGYQGTQNVEVRPGATTSVSVLPKGEVTVEGPKGAELFVDGDRVGELPIEKLKTPIGTREFVFKVPDEGERRQVVVVTMTSPATVKYSDATKD